MSDFSNYFNSYEDLNVHEIMLRDRPRQDAYRDAIQQCRSLIEGKTVLDVGAGTGFLSVLCAQVGAKRVFAVEASNIAKLANDVVNENNVQHIVQVFHTPVEEFVLPDGVEDVDIIISEWMGFYLLHEGMLDSVIWARDRFLSPDGLIFPASATITLAPCSLPPCVGGFNWSDVDGVRMSTVGNAIKEQKSQRPEVMSIPEEMLLQDGTVMAWLDLRDVTLEEVQQLRFKDVIVVDRPGKFEGVCIWFECEFPIVDNSGDSVVLSTGPSSPHTHWKQTVVVLPDNAREDVDSRDPIAFSLQISRNEENPRRYNMELALIDCDDITHPTPCDCIMTKCILTKAHLQSLQHVVTIGGQNSRAIGETSGDANGLENGHDANKY